MSSASEKITLLFIGCSPRDQPHLDLNGEFDQLELACFDVHSRWDVSASKLPELLDERRPEILHFSGHGSQSGELLFVDGDGHAYAPDGERLAQVFARCGGGLRCVVLNACFSQSQAERIAEHVDVVIGISNAISDANARSFTRAFYRALGRGLSVQAAFERAELTLALGPEGGRSGLRLLGRSGTPASEIVLLPSPVAAESLATVPLSAHRYERTSAWRQALGTRSNGQDESPRAQLRLGFRHMCDAASTLAGGSGRVDHVAQLDALWELVDVIGGEGELPLLSPCEAFVLGGAMLTTQLAETAAAYQGGLAELREQTRWRDAVAQLLRQDGLELQPNTAVPEHIARAADREALVSLRADKASELPTQRRTDEQGRELHFIEDQQLRDCFAQLIGRLASRHAWPLDRLREEFDKPIGLPRPWPAKWTLDPLRVACLLRAVDVAHVDDGRMSQPVREGEQLHFSASTPFVADEASCWWRAVERLRAIDAELRSIDTLLQVTGRERLAARRVAAVEDLRVLSAQLPVAGWEPVDTRVRISNIPALIERLGGRSLYGNDRDAPLRELIQNAADAVRARRAHESRPSSWGHIVVAEGRDEHGPWLEVRDNGVGMSKALLVGPLLDFGVSYWASELCCEEFPGLHASGFRSVGEFGIGFFSVFMWGPKLRITSRSCRVAQTSVLEFDRGLSTPPLLRYARASEHLVDGGTTVRIWLTEANEEPSLFGRARGLAARCEWQCPTLDVDLYVQASDDDAKPTRVIGAADWLELPAEAFLRRLVGRDGELEEQLTSSSLADDDFELERVLALIDTIVDPATQQVLGRACLRPPWLESQGSVLVTRGLRLDSAPQVASILGVLEGVASKAARDEGRVCVPPALLQAWYERQEAKVADSFEGFGRFEFASVLALAMAKPVTRLPVLWGHRGWTLAELAAHTQLPPVIILVFPGTFARMSETTMRGSRREQPVADLPAQVFMLCSGLRLNLDRPKHNNPTLIAILESIARAWRVDPTAMLKSSLLSHIENAEHRRAIPNDEVWGGRIHMICHPESSRESRVAAVTEFYELTKKHPDAVPAAQARMVALGRRAGDIYDRRRAQQRERRGKP